MSNEPPFARLLSFTTFAILVCAGSVLLCYLFVDRPVALYVYDQRLSSFPALKWLTYPPPIVQAWSPLVIAMLMIRRAWGSFRRWELVLLSACVSLILADQFRESLSYMFGRTWPETWIDNNPSFIQDGVFGFHFFHGGIGYESFPSGHMTRSVAIGAVAWIAWPRCRPICAVACGTIAIGLIGMNYHFVGDVIAGAFVGGIVGTYTARFCEAAAEPMEGCHLRGG